MKKVIYSLFGAFPFLVLTGCQSTNEPSIFQNTLVQPFEQLIYFFAEITGGNFGLSIILITLLVRLVLMPSMLKQTKNQQLMKEKMEMVKPDLEEIQRKLKETQDIQEQQKLQQDMIKLYQKHGINPLNMGCLPLLIQMPILMGLYYAIIHSHEIATHSFLWFDLGQSNLWMTAIAGLVYLLQYKISQLNMTAEQQKQFKLIGLLSPIMIIFVSLNAPAALPLYWSIGGLFLIVQNLIAKKLYRPQMDEIKPEHDR
ncbi:membrane protein insertase YidC [Mesobacillus maritimus]|uniref:membrane protein insertase YidC n=1 Tax=Mesobacillus maritimus TaxID=1643336 RepID=UPI00203EB68C|nr:membrane protein insertase YidC [Mesobacillus maritimus]MCM3588085.1 membrane protein insertase YidC [Mesobacillus maritimus]MCM3668416.1 membrane protein insertase YidC [Mesobacillus maritimus]